MQTKVFILLLSLTYTLQIEHFELLFQHFELLFQLSLYAITKPTRCCSTSDSTFVIVVRHFPGVLLVSEMNLDSGFTGFCWVTDFLVFDIFLGLTINARSKFP